MQHDAKERAEAQVQLTLNEADADKDARQAVTLSATAADGARSPEVFQGAKDLEKAVAEHIDEEEAEFLEEGWDEARAGDAVSVSRRMQHDERDRTQARHSRAEALRERDRKPRFMKWRTRSFATVSRRSSLVIRWYCLENCCSTFRSCSSSSSASSSKFAMSSFKSSLVSWSSGIRFS